MRAIRKQYEPAWLQNVAFYMGDQWTLYDKNLARIYEPPRKPHRVRHIVNVAKPRINRWIARCTQNAPTLVAEPATETEADRASARAAEAFLRYALRATRFRSVLRQTLKFAGVLGCGVMRPSWDWTAGEWKEQERYVPDMESGTLLDMMSGNEIPFERFRGNPNEMVVLPLGDVALTSVNPFDFWWDTEARSIVGREVKKSVERDFMLIDEIAETWDKGKYVRPERPDQSQAQDYGRRMVWDFSESGAGAPFNPNDIQDRSIVYRYFEAPHPDRPNGRMVIWAGDVLLVDDALPWGLRGIPHRFFPCDIVPWRVWPRSHMDELRAPQTERNRSLSVNIENRNVYGHQPLLVPDGSGIRPGSWTAAPGLVLRYRAVGNHKPAIMQMPQPPTTEPLVARADLDMDSITSQNEVSQARVPGGVRAGTAIQALQEADQIALSPYTDEYEMASELVANDLLVIARGNYGEKRLVKIAGEANESDVVELMGSDLNGGFDVRVQAGSMRLQTQMAKEQRALMLWSAKLVTDPRRVLRMMGDQATLDLQYKETAQSQIARRENQMMRNGQHVPVAPEEDHRLHIEVHEACLNERKFAEDRTPQEEATLRDHIAEHYAQAVAASGRRAMLMAYDAAKQLPAAGAASPANGQVGGPAERTAAMPAGGGRAAGSMATPLGGQPPSSSPPTERGAQAA